MSEDRPKRLSRRQALQQIAVAGSAVWVVPAVQTINMNRAFAQTQMSQPSVCSWFRISQEELTTGGTAGTCGQPISPSDSCLSAFGVMDCSPVLGMPSAPSGSDWTACLIVGYQVHEVALFDTAGHCWLSVADPADPMIGQPVQSANGTGGWVGWTMVGGCLNVHRPTDALGTPIDIAHFDVVACAEPTVLRSGSPSSSSTATPSDPPSPSDSSSPSDTTTADSPTATPTPGS